MKIAVKINQLNRPNPIQKAIEAIFLGVAGSGITLTADANDADVVITTKPTELLGYLKQGKYVIQLLTFNHQPAVGLLTAPMFKDRFRIFAPMNGLNGGYPGFMDMLAFVQELNTTPKENTYEHPRG